MSTTVIIPESSIPEKNADILSAHRDQIIHDSTTIEKIPHPVSSISNPESRILIVEDNTDLRQYIRSNIEGQYRISEAENGEKGLEKATKDIPDLIISDVMMPWMDGFEFCTKIKTDERTSHIPVILLTARAAQEDKIEGLETGADDYLSKPFDVNELLVRIKNLIEQRRRLRERFSHENFLEPKAFAVSSADEAFLKKAIAIIQEHLTEPEFNVNRFSKEIGFSRSQLHRKILGLTNLVPNHFIRMLRMQHAKQLLDKKYATVSEIAYESGFSNLSYFSRCFKEQFGQTPSEYEKNNIQLQK